MNLGICSFIFLLGFQSMAQASTWKIATLEFPPHTCQKDCDGNGSMNKTLSEALKNVGVKTEFYWLPWSRAINETKKGKYIGYYPAWPEDCQSGFMFSETISRSDLGIAERISHPLMFKQATDLAQYKIGTVQDYGNTKEINEMIQKGILKSEMAVKDEMNIKKVALGRLDGALVDVSMLKHFLMYQHPEYKNLIQLNPTIIENKRMGICIRKSLWQSLNNTLKKAFKKVDPIKTSAEALKKHFASRAKKS